MVTVRPISGTATTATPISGDFLARNLTLALLTTTLFLYPTYLQAESVHTVSRVIDGNTLELSNGEQVRLIGVDTPEFKDQERNRRNAQRLGIDPEHYASYAQKAKDYLRRIEGVAVKLEYDEINESIRHRDKYDRVLAYVYAYAFAKAREGFVPDGVYERWSDDQSKGNIMHLMNAKLVALGYGLTYSRFDFKYKERFLELEGEARDSKRGIWSVPKNRFQAAEQTEALSELLQEMDEITSRRGTPSEGS